MHVSKYTHGWTRRYFLEQMARGIVTTGVLAPLFSIMYEFGDVTKAYPEELLSLEAYTKGRIKEGDTLTADNVDLVKDLLDPGVYYTVKHDSRRVTVHDATTDLYKLNPKPYVDQSLKNKDRYRFDNNGIVVGKDGKPWQGGNPFPEPKTAQELAANGSMSWGRWDTTFYPINHRLFDKDGNQTFYYTFVWTEVNTVGRLVVEPKPYFPGQTDLLRKVTIFVLSPTDVHGTNVLQEWSYDSTKFPLMHGYLPLFHRVRTFPTNQRFEPIIPGSPAYFSDTWETGDPYGTWGNFKIVGKGPRLGGMSRNWWGDNPDWEPPRSGGKTGQKYYSSHYELVPEAIAFEMEPIRYPRSPYGRKRIWMDVRTGTPINMLVFDRAGKPWKFWEQTYGIYQTEKHRMPESGPYPWWSWSQAQLLNLQDFTAGIFNHLPNLGSQWIDHFNDPKGFDWVTQTALAQYGEA